jgi:hypothetical protein
MAEGADTGRRGGAALIAVLIAALAVAGCESSSDEQRDALADYVAEVEPIRLEVNELLDEADPITEAYAAGEISAEQAQRRFGALERRFADYTVRIAAVEDVPEQIQAAHDAYAHTYILEDAYLSALEAAIPSREFDDLPDTKDAQRADVIAWRTRLQVLADRVGLELPADLQQAGRGEIAPSPVGD